MKFISKSKLVVISGLADFENNLWSQIKNQDKVSRLQSITCQVLWNVQIIKTLRDRLAAAEKQTESVNLIVSTLKSNNQAHQKELRLAGRG